MPPLELASQIDMQIPAQPGFWSYKCDQPVHYTRRSARDALIQATLDPSIKKILPAPSADQFAAPADAYFAFSIIQHASKCLIILCDESGQLGSEFAAPPGHDISVAVPRFRLVSQTVASAARMIWARRKLQVHPSFAIELLLNLRNYRGTAKLGDVLAIGDCSNETKMDWALAMACSGLINVHLSGHALDSTPISLGACAGTTNDTMLPQPQSVLL